MASNPHQNQLTELLTTKADELMEKIAAGHDIQDMAAELGVYPAQLKKFFASSPAHRDKFREALETAKELREAVVRTSKKKAASVGKPKTQAEIVAMFADEILARIAEGELTRKIARGLEVDQSTVSRYFNSSDELKQKYREAIEEGGHALAEMSVEVTEGVALDAVDASVMQTRSNRLAWLAAKRNEIYDQRQQIKHSGTLVSSVSIDIGAGD
jgi:predicted transcriptional regulator